MCYGAGTTKTRGVVHMQIGVTNPLRQFLGWKAFPARDGSDPLFCWDAHRTEIGGRKMLVVCNAANRFAGITAMRAADWRRLDAACLELVEEAMTEAGFSDAAAAAYLERAGEVEFGRTHGRSAVGCMNRMIDALMWQGAERDVRFQAQLTRFANEVDLCHCASRKDYGYAAEWMAEDLRTRGIEPFAARTIEPMTSEEARERQPGNVISDFTALKKWRELPEWERETLLGSVFCANCGEGEFAPGYAIRQGEWGIVIEGACAKCGSKIARVREEG